MTLSLFDLFKLFATLRTELHETNKRKFSVQAGMGTSSWKQGQSYMKSLISVEFGCLIKFSEAVSQMVLDSLDKALFYFNILYMIVESALLMLSVK